MTSRFGMPRMLLTCITPFRPANRDVTRPQPYEAEAEATTHEAEAEVEATTHEAEAEAEAKTHPEIIIIRTV